MPMKRVFLDASCWVAAAGSATVGSSLILKLARASHVRLVATRRVLQEAEYNIRTKMGEESLLRYYQLLGSVELELVSPVTSEEEAKWLSLVTPKDAHVLAGAAKAKADVLISLDRRHILTERAREGFPIPVQDTGEFLRGIAEKVESQRRDCGEP
ncbi:MAG: PIN domain-containing protein [Candidatus Fermentithermobacillus carboniphilus]|uniref:PIN domain-containing protein n=1 Tax=Candidatus Fermentithermobacillus carboniphilus TaxID=3085328 RepID=A0AAT9LGA3_9FIRM|nr:MAG: PIN domain-containing protein [Candidatus Fermentithermobacillus carboniphilus]